MNIRPAMSWSLHEKSFSRRQQHHRFSSLGLKGLPNLEELQPNWLSGQSGQGVDEHLFDCPRW